MPIRKPFATTIAVFFNTVPLLSLLLLVGADATPQSGSSFMRVQAQCRNMLTKISDTGHSHFELAALCRARVPIPVCHDALRSLGQSPWTHEKIATTCRDVQSNWHARFLSTAIGRKLQSGVATFSQIQAILDEAMLAKSVIGICTNMTLDECAQFKAKNYPVKAKEIERAITLKYHYWNGEMQNAGKEPEFDALPTAASTDVQPLASESQEKFQKMDVAQIKSPNLALTIYASFMTLLAAVALMGLVVLRMRRSGDISRSPALRSKRARRGKAEESLMFGTCDGEDNGNTCVNPE